MLPQNGKCQGSRGGHSCCQIPQQKSGVPCLAETWHMSLYMLLISAVLTSLTTVQLCMVSVNRDGLSLRWEDNSKSLQSSVWLHSEASIADSVQLHT